jgi:hypothetical protein
LKAQLQAFATPANVQSLAWRLPRVEYGLCNIVPLGSESNSVQRPFIRYAVEAGWKYLSPDEALNLRQGGVTSPVLDVVLLGHLTKLNPCIVNGVLAALADMEIPADRFPDLRRQLATRIIQYS